MNFFPLPNEPAKRKQRTKTSTVALHREDVPYELFTDEELYAAKSGILVFDLEVYVNYFIAGFRCFNTDKIVYFELWENEKFDTHKLLWVLHNFCIVGFNSNYFDIVLIWLAMQPGITTETLKNVTNFIIKENMRPSDIERMYNFKMGSINHIDLIEVAPLSASLKAYAGRMHARRLQELPFLPESRLSASERLTVRNYNFTDLEDTLLLLKELSPQLELRQTLSKQYGQDLRSKSDAQIAEAVLCGELKQINGYWAKRPTIEPGTVYKYQVPNFIKYSSYMLQRMLKIVANVDFVIADNGQVLEPKEFEQLKAIPIGSSVYRMGIGGLHSTEENVSHVANENTLLVDRDVNSYYPSIILTQGLYPKHLGQNFLNVYRSIVERRLRAKKNKDKVYADSLKIVCNGSFGKLGSKYSSLYSPDLMLQVTISGQLCLLMLIEMLEHNNIPVISGNTDGIIIKCNKNQYTKLNDIIIEWEKITGFETEETRYKAVYSRDVNNFIIVKYKYDEEKKEWTNEIDGCKVKGCYSEKGSALNSRLSKNPDALICSDAVQALFTKNIPIEQTIKSCKDITRFVSVIKVTGGGEKDGIYLGKTVRYYYAKGIQGCINRVANGNKVPKTDGGKPCQDLPPSFPNDIDYERYIQIANDILIEIGYTKVEKQQTFF
jgi:DNA polymerase elongation subunit (family B)